VSEAEPSHTEKVPDPLTHASVDTTPHGPHNGLNGRKRIVQKSPSHRRLRAWWGLVLMSMAVGSLAGCLGTIQREMEVLFAPGAMENALLIPQSILYNMFGPSLFELMKLL